MPDEPTGEPDYSADQGEAEQLAHVNDPAASPKDEGSETSSPPSEYSYEGVWPPWWKKLWWDIWIRSGPNKTDGLEAPTPKRPYWLDESGSDSDLVLDAARATRAYSDDRLERAEIRASRLLQTTFVLLTIGFASTGFLLNRLLERANSWEAYLLLIPSFLAFVFLIPAAVQTLGVGRVGLGMAPRPGVIAESSETTRVSVAAHEEVNAALITNWTADKKLSETNGAFRWVSRGILALILSGFAVLGAMFLLREGCSQDALEECSRTCSHDADTQIANKQGTCSPIAPL